MGGTSWDRAPVVQLRGIAWMSMDDTGYVLRSVGTDTGAGGVTETWGTVGTLDCRIDPIGSRGGELSNQISERTSHVVTTVPLADVTSRDRFKIGTTVYEVTAVRNRTLEQVREFEVTTT